MRRAALVMLLATLTAVVSGINEASWAGEEPSAQAREEGRQRVVERLAGIPLQAVVRIDRTDGSRVDDVLGHVAPDSITVTVLRPERDEGTALTISIDEIEKVEELRGSTLRKVLIGVGIAVAVVVGTCAIALNSDKSPTVTGTDPAPRPRIATTPTVGESPTPRR